MRRRSRTVLWLLPVVVMGAERLAAHAEPSPEMKKLEFLVGRWTATRTHIEPGRAPREMTENRTSRWVANERYILTEVTRQRAGGGDRSGVQLVLMGYDAEAKLYRTWTFLSIGDGPAEAEGRFQGTKLVLTPKMKEGPSFGGINAAIDEQPVEGGHFRIHRVFPGGPADRAGVRMGDVIKAVNGISVSGKNRDQVIAAIRGPAGNPVRLTLLRNGRDEEVSIVRRMVAPEIGILLPQHSFEPRSKSSFALVIEPGPHGGGPREPREWVFTALP